MLQDFSTSTVGTINAPLWTMPVDFEFYFALPVLAWVAVRLVGRLAAASRVTAICALLVGMIFLSVLFRGIVTSREYDTLTRLQSPAVFVYLDNGLGMACTFAIGILLSIGCRVTRMRLPAGGCVLVAIVLFGIIARTNGNVGLAKFNWTFESLLAAVSTALLLYALPYFKGVVRVAETGIVATGASMSYAIYLFHYPVLEAIFNGFHLQKGNSSFLILLFATALLLGPLAYAAHHLIERPFLILKDLQR